MYSGGAIKDYICNIKEAGGAMTGSQRRRVQERGAGKLLEPILIIPTHVIHQHYHRWNGHRPTYKRSQVVPSYSHPLLAGREQEAH